MISIPRSAVRTFRAVVRKGLAGRSREPAPPVALIPEAGAVTFLVHLPFLVITYRVPTDHPAEEPIVLPMAVIDAVTGPGQETVTIESQGPHRAEVSWVDRGQPQTQSVDLERTEAVPDRPADPRVFLPVAADYLVALHEAGRTAGAANGRYAFDHLQLKGRTGEVVATDGQNVYLHGGFRVPFRDSILLPALPIFGAPELAAETEIHLGRTETHFVLKLGAWTFWWSLDTGGRFPDVAAVIPKASPTTAILEIDEADAEELRVALPRLPGGKDDRRAVTLDLAPGQPPVVRARSDSEGIAEVPLSRSTVTNGSVRVVVDRAFLARALRLGCRTFRVASAEQPVVARKGTMLFVTGSLDPSLIVTPKEAPTTSTEMVLVSPNVPAAEPVTAIAIPAEPAGPAVPVDPLVEAEALGAVLVEAGQRLGRLVEWFNTRRREPRALARAWSRLQSLTSRSRGGSP